MGRLDEGLQRQHRAEGVGHVRHRHQARARAEEFQELLQLQLAAAVDRRHLEGAAGLLAQHLPGDDVGVMLERADEDLVAGPQARAAPGLRDEVDRLGGAAHKNDLARTAGVDETPYALARALVRGGSRLTERDRKSTRLNSSHLVISYAVFCLKKKKMTRSTRT